MEKPKQPKKLQPHENTIDSLLEGEIWKDIPGFEEYYQASNLGRIRSVDRVVPHPRLGQQFVKGRILKQSKAVNKNTMSDEKMVDLRVSLNFDGKPHYFNTRRIVYMTFVDPDLDYEKDRKVIVNKDCNGYNNAVNNLGCITNHDKTQRAIDRNRVPESYLATADRTGWVSGGVTRRKPVRKLDMDGQVLETYESITAASKANNVGEKEIIMVAKGRYKSWNGVKWEYVKKKDKKK